MSHPSSSLFARSTETHPASGSASSLFARSNRRVRTVALGDIVDDLLASRLTQLTHLEQGEPTDPPADPAPVPASGAVDEHFDDLDDVVALDLLGDGDGDEGDDDFDDEHLAQLEDLLDLDEIDAHHVATRDDDANGNDRDMVDTGTGDDSREPRDPPQRELVRQSRIIRNRWDVRDRRIGLDHRSGPLDLRDRFAVTDREAAESLACLVEWLLARPVVTDLARVAPRGLFSLHALGRASVHADHLGAPRALDPFFTFET